MDLYDKILDDTIRKHFDYCIKYKRYIDGFMISSSDKLNTLIFKIKEIAKEKKYYKRICQIKLSKFETRVIFKNGSIIRMFVVKESFRACKLNGAIIDSDINDDIVKCIISPMFIKRIRCYPKSIIRIAEKLNIYLSHQVKNDNYRPRVDYITIKKEI